MKNENASKPISQVCNGRRIHNRLPENVKPLPDALVHEIISFAVQYNLQKAELKEAAEKVKIKKKG